MAAARKRKASKKVSKKRKKSKASSKPCATRKKRAGGKKRQSGAKKKPSVKRRKKCATVAGAAPKKRRRKKAASAPGASSPKKRRKRSKKVLVGKKASPTQRAAEMLVTLRAKNAFLKKCENDVRRLKSQIGSEGAKKTSVKAADVLGTAKAARVAKKGLKTLKGKKLVSWVCEGPTPRGCAGGSRKVPPGRYRKLTSYRWNQAVR